MKFQLGDTVTIDLDDKPTGKVIAAYDGSKVHGDQGFNILLSQCYSIYHEPSYIVQDEFGDPWTCHESIVHLDDFLTRLLNRR